MKVSSRSKGQRIAAEPLRLCKAFEKLVEEPSFQKAKDVIAFALKHLRTSKALGLLKAPSP